MRDNEREKLYYLLQDVKCPMHFLDNKQVLDTTDYLLANGVIVPPCKVGDVLYTVLPQHFFDQRIVEEKIEGFSVSIVTDKSILPIRMVGDIAFLAREEAEQALKGGAE